MRLKEKLAVVTGATSGIGAAIARLFAAEGAALVLNGRRADAGEALVEEISRAGGRAVFIAGDLRDEDTSRRIAAGAADLGGRIDALMLNAGVGTVGAGAFWETSPAQFDEVFDTNVKGPWLCAVHALPLLRAGSAVVVTASMSSYIVYPGETVYSASKGAVLQLARGMAIDLAGRGIRVNALCPGIIDTPLVQWFLERAEDREALEDEYNTAPPMGRMGTPEEIARAALFLASEDASYCTGSSLLADGGFMIR